jgi:serine/threonine-protein kinase
MSRSIVKSRPTPAAGVQGRANPELTRMEHPHVVKVHDAGDTAGLRGPPYLAGVSAGGSRGTEEGPARGRPSGCRRRGSAPVPHDHGLVHRDVKPTNILFDEQGNVFVADFGIAKALGERESGLTQTGQTPGSPEYMAPEVVTGGELGPSYDQYALGVVVYQALSGRFPFEGNTPLQVLVKKRTDRPVPLGRLAPEVPSGVAIAVMRAIDRDPAPGPGTGAGGDRTLGKRTTAEDARRNRALEGRPATGRSGFRPASWSRGDRSLGGAAAALWRRTSSPAPGPGDRRNASLAREP